MEMQCPCLILLGGQLTVPHPQRRALRKLSFLWLTSGSRLTPCIAADTDGCVLCSSQARRTHCWQGSSTGVATGTLGVSADTPQVWVPVPSLCCCHSDPHWELYLNKVKGFLCWFQCFLLPLIERHCTGLAAPLAVSNHILGSLGLIPCQLCLHTTCTVTVQSNDVPIPYQHWAAGNRHRWVAGGVSPIILGQGTWLPVHVTGEGRCELILLVFLQRLTVPIAQGSLLVPTQG